MEDIRARAGPTVGATLRSLAGTLGAGLLLFGLLLVVVDQLDSVFGLAAMRTEVLFGHVIGGCVAVSAAVLADRTHGTRAVLAATASLCATAATLTVLWFV